jgi:hypothetical protein
MEFCHSRHGREAVVGDPGKILFETGSPASSRMTMCWIPACDGNDKALVENGRVI